MANVLTTYDPKEVKIVWNGIDLSDAIAPDSFITVTRMEDGFAPTVGSSGTVVRTRNANKMGQIDITLLQNAPENNALAAAALLDEQTDVYSVIAITDPSGSADFVLATDAWIRKIADIDLGSEYGSRTWNFDCAELTIVG